MANIQDSLSKAGIKNIQGQINPIYSGVKYGGRTQWNKFAISEAQRNWHVNHAQNPISFSPWGYLSAPDMSQVDVQRTIRSFESFNSSLGINPFVMMDIETTGLNTASSLFHPTEIAMGAYSDFGRPTGLLNMAVAPTSKFGEYRNLLKKARAGSPLTREERYAAASFLRYADTGSIDANHMVIGHSPLFTNEIANGTSRFTKSQVRGMRKGLFNLMRQGVPEHEVAQRINSFFEEHNLMGQKFHLVGHNIERFDIPALSSFMGKDKWEGLVAGANGIVDTYNISRMVNGDSTIIYKRHLYNEIRRTYGNGPLSHHARRQINREVGRRMHEIDFDNAGLLTMDSLRRLTGVEMTDAHMAAVDVMQEEKVFRRLHPTLQRMVHEGLVDARSGINRGTKPGMVDRLKYNPLPMQVGDNYISMGGLQATGNDFAITDTGEVLSKWVLNSKAVYQYQGAFRDGDIVGAKFYSPYLNMTSYLTGGTEEEVRRKIQGGTLQFIRPEDIGNLPEEVLNDLARQNINKWTSITGGFDRVKKYVDHYLGRCGLDTFVEQRTFNTIKTRLASEADALSGFIDVVGARPDLSNEERNLAFKLFYQDYNRIAPLPQEYIDRSWDATVPILGRNVSLRHDRFFGSARSALSADIAQNATPRAVERSRTIRFNEAVSDLVEQGYVRREDAMAIRGMRRATLRDKLGSLRTAIMEGNKAIGESSMIPVESMRARLVIVDKQRAAEMATAAVNRALSQTRGIYEGADFGGILSASNPNRERMLNAVDRVVTMYQEKMGLGVHVAEIGGHLRMFVNSGDMSSFEGINNALNAGRIPEGVLSLEIPTLSKAGHIVYGSEVRINPAGRLIPGKSSIYLKDMYEDVVDTIVRRAGKVKEYMVPQTGSPDLERARRVVTSSVRDVFEKASGISRATTADLFEESNRLDVRGNFADILRGKQVNVQGMYATLSGKNKRWDEASLDDLTDFLSTFQAKAMEKYGANPFARNLIERMTGEGLKEEKFRKGFFSLATERDYTPFGIMSSASRPNLVQWLNFYGYDADELQGELDRRLKRFGHMEGISLNPYLITKSEAEAYAAMSQGGRSYATGISVGAIQLSSKEYMDVLQSGRGQQILTKYGLSVEDVTSAGTWEQGVVASPELRNLLEGRQPKAFEVALEDINSGRARLSKEVQGWMDSGAKGSMRLKKGQTLFEEAVTVGGSQQFVSTDFEDDLGRLLSVEEVADAEGNRLLRFNAEAVHPMTNSSKVMFDTRKGTLSFFGPQTRSVRASRAMHEMFGEETHLIYLGNVTKHMDVAADIKGQVDQLIQIFQFDKPKMDEIAEAMSRHFGPTQVVQLPGRRGWTIQMPDASYMARNPRVTPESIKTGVDAIINQFAPEGFTQELPSGLTVAKSAVELRRMNVNETYRVADYLGEGLSSGAGLKIGPREIRSLRAKGMILGTDMEPLIQHLQAEGEMMPGRQAYRTAAQDMKRAVGYLVNPQAMGELPTRNVGDLEAFAKFRGQKWYLREQLTEGAGTIIGQENMFSFQLPVDVELNIGRGREGYRRISAVPVARQMLKPDDKGRVFLNDQSRSLMNLYEAVESYESFNVTDAAHGAYDRQADALAAIHRYTSEYVDTLGRDLTSSEGQVIEHAMKYRVSTSGRLRAQNISANLQLDEHLSGTVHISPDLMEEMFGQLSADSPVRQALYGEQGFYGVLMRDPNESAWNFAVMNYKVDSRLRGRSARMAATEAAMMGADFDGDQVGMLSPFTKRMENLLETDPQAYNQLQMQLGGIHGRQTQYNTALAADIRSRYSSEASRQTPREFADIFKEAYTSHGIIAGDEYYQRVMSAHLSKTAAGPLYNVAQRYGDVGQAIFAGVSDPAERAQRVELLNMFTEITTERLSLKGKMGSPLSPKEVSTLKSELMKGADIAERWRTHYAQAMSDNTAVSWSGSRGMLEAAGVSSWAEAAPELQSQIKLTLADRMLRNVEDIQTTAVRSGFGTYFTVQSEASRTFFSEQAYNKSRKNLVGLYNQYMSIRPDDDTFMSNFVPTEHMASFAEATGQAEQFVVARQRFYDRLLVTDTISNAPPMAAEGVTEAVTHTAERAEQAIADVVEEASMWKRIPSWLKIGGAAVGGLAVLGALSRKEPSPGRVPDEEPFDGPTARVAMNNEPGPQTSGHRIMVKARNERNVSLDSVSEGVKHHVKEGNVNIYQKDDTRTVNHQWAQELFTGAIKYGKGQSGTGPNSY